MLENLTTESRNPASEAIDALSALEIVRLMNAEDARVAAAVGAQAEQIADAIEIIAGRFEQGGRLVYLGAGTSGRLGVLDATECPPTFNSPLGQVVGLIAGGPTALTRAVEGAEDRPELAIEDLRGIGLEARDVVVGIATSGRTPYVIGGLQYARTVQAATIGLSCNAASALAALCDVAIAPVVGPEVISGSTRLKAGTATKLVLNTLTTGAMVRIGKTYGNLMVDLRATNTKLRARAARMVAQLTGRSEQQAQELLNACDGELKTAVVLDRLPSGANDRVAVARRYLQEAGGQLRRALAAAGSSAGRPVVHADLILGIDGGGTGTLALLARVHSEGSTAVLGRGMAGPSNPQAIGFEAAFRALDESISAAFGDAGLTRGEVEACCLALAGGGREGDHRQLEAWAASRHVARDFQQVHDALPLLAEGTPHGWGIALIAGTGSLAFGQTAEGRTARAGGWGYLFGDEGSAYWIALAALRSVAAAADGRGPATILTEHLLAALSIGQPQQLVPAVHGCDLDRAALATLAPHVVAAAEAGDAEAGKIVTAAAAELALMVASVAQQLELPPREFPLALAGGVLAESEYMARAVRQQLSARDLHPASITLVPEPVLGALRLAARCITETAGGGGFSSRASDRPER